MTTVQENEELTRTGPGTPMGALFRWEWIDAARAEKARHRFFR